MAYTKTTAQPSFSIPPYDMHWIDSEAVTSVILLREVPPPLAEKLLRSLLETAYGRGALHGVKYFAKAITEKKAE